MHGKGDRRVMYRMHMIILFNLGLSLLKIEFTIEHTSFSCQPNGNINCYVLIGYQYLLARRRRASARQAASSYLVVNIECVHSYC
jgi:hypothetical protein